MIETIRRWIRSGRLRVRSIGTQHVIEESDLAPLLEDELGTQHVIEERDLAPLLEEEMLPPPPEWGRTATGEPMPNAVRAIRLSRLGH